MERDAVAARTACFDLRLRSNKVLVLRNDEITVRTDADISLKGPLNAGSANRDSFCDAGPVFQGRGYPAGGATRPPEAAGAIRTTPMIISFPDPPLRDWKFDIAIKTRENDSFLIRGNLAKGAAALDLRLGGTGLNPFLSGNVQIESFRALLPASTLEVRRGYVTFSPEEPFQPQIDIQAESRIRKTTITANISGSATAPHMELESEPRFRRRRFSRSSRPERQPGNSAAMPAPSPQGLQF